MADGQLHHLGHLGSAVLALEPLGLELVTGLAQDLDALFHLLHADHVAVHRVAVLVNDLVEVELFVQRVGVGLAHVAVPSAGAARGTGDVIGDGVLFAQDAHARHAVHSDDVAGEELVVFLEGLLDDVARVAHVLDEVLMHVGHHAADGAVAHRHAGAAGAVKDIVDQLPLTETVEEGGRGTLVHR